MAREFRLPDIGEGLTEAEIVRWLIDEGQRVEADQPIVEVETDKAVVEIPSPYAGVVLRHGGGEGDTISVGEVLVVIGEETEAAAARSNGGETITPDESSETDRSGGSWVEQGPPPRSSESPPIVGTLSEEAEILAVSRSGPSMARESEFKALPIVRKLAREHGIDLSAIAGTGPEGRITRDDIESFIREAKAESERTPEETPAVTTTDDRAPEPEIEDRVTETTTVETAGEDRRPLSRLRRTIAANMARSWAEIPHVTTFDDVDAGRLLDVRRALGERSGVSIPLEALIVKAVLPVLEAFPEFNATIDGDDLVVHHAYHMGIAVDTNEGLLVAVMRDAARLSMLEIASEVRRLGEGARARSLTPGELTGQTFTVSNIGALGGGHGTPIVPHGTTAILSVGRAQQRPVVRDGEVTVAAVMPLSLSYDHRVIDGGHGRRFMSMLMENLEEPALFLAR